MTPTTNFDSRLLAKVLSRLGKPTPAKADTSLTPERLTEYARLMTAKGYEHTTESLAALADYASGYGIGLNGHVGTGKTFFFRCLPPIGRNPEKPIQVFPMLLVNGMKLEDIRTSFDGFAGTEVVLDDIGTESLQNEYGVKSEALEYILALREARWVRTHYTTNLTPAQLLKRYGDRIVDRLTALAKRHTLAGASRREAQPNRAALRFMAIEASQNQLPASAGRPCRGGD